MDRKRALELVIMGLWLLIAIILTISKNNHQSEAPLPNELSLPIIPQSDKGKSFDVQRITVLRGDYFDLTMTDDQTRILGELTVNATENSKAKVIDLFNHSDSPRVILLEKKPNGHWIIDFFFKQNDIELNLVDWLTKNKLVYK